MMKSSHVTSNQWPRPRQQPQRIVRPTRVAHVSAPAIERRYDAESGQVYSEMEVHFNRRQNSDWIGEPRTPSLIRRAAPHHGKGARSLVDMAKNKIATQFRNLTEEHFLTVPWSVAEKVWKELLDQYGCRRSSFVPIIADIAEQTSREFSRLENIGQSVSAHRRVWPATIQVSPRSQATAITTFRIFIGH